MQKQVKIIDLKIGQEFYSCGSKYIKSRTMHHSCYEVIKNSCFGIMIDESGNHTGTITGFMDNACVTIEVPGLKFKDIKIGESFTCNGTQYEKLFLDSNSYLGRKDKYLYKFNPEQEVEKV